MDVIDGMRTFAAVAQAGSFTAAAERLSMSTALASKYVGQLEARLGARLLHRTTRSLTLTDVGAAYLQRCRQLLDDFDELEDSVQDRNRRPRGALIVTAPVTFGEMYLTPVVARFLATYEDITVDLRLTDRFVGLVDEGVDLAIRIAEMSESALIARRLAPARVVACASPDYLARYGAPASPDELSAHSCIVDTNFRAPTNWPFQVDGRRVSVPITGRFSVNSARAARAMVVAGAGVGMIPTYAIGDDLRAGRARPILTSFEAFDLGIYAVYLPNRHLAAKVRVFIDFMVAEFGPAPAWDRGTG